MKKSLLLSCILLASVGCGNKEPNQKTDDKDHKPVCTQPGQIPDGNNGCKCNTEDGYSDVGGKCQKIPECNGFGRIIQNGECVCNEEAGFVPVGDSCREKCADSDTDTLRCGNDANGNGVLICKKDNDKLYLWQIVSDKSCNSQTAETNPQICREGNEQHNVFFCADKCQATATSCRTIDGQDYLLSCANDGFYKLESLCINGCNDAGDGCKAMKKCTIGENPITDVNEAAGGNQEAVEIDHGTRVCTSETTIEECQNGAMVAVNETCGGDKPVCDNGACVTCINTAKKCVAAKDETTGVYSHTLFTCTNNTWDEGEACPSGTVCDQFGSNQCLEPLEAINCHDLFGGCLEEEENADTYGLSIAVNGCPSGDYPVGSNGKICEEGTHCAQTGEDEMWGPTFGCVPNE